MNVDMDFTGFTLFDFAQLLKCVDFCLLVNLGNFQPYPFPPLLL